MSKAFEKLVLKPPMTKEQGEEELRNMKDEVGKALAEHIFEPLIESTDAANEPDSEEPAAPIGQPSPEEPTLDWMTDSETKEETDKDQGEKS